MNNTAEKTGQLVNLTEAKAEEATRQRPRAMTTLKLQWLAERLRKAERIKQALADGTYHVDSALVARAVLGLDPSEQEGE